MAFVGMHANAAGVSSFHVAKGYSGRRTGTFVCMSRNMFNSSTSPCFRRKAFTKLSRLHDRSTLITGLFVFHFDEQPG
jgi:hypothetical protein